MAPGETSHSFPPHLTEARFGSQPHSPRGHGGGSEAAPKESEHEGKHLGQKWPLTQPVGSRDGHCFPGPTPLCQGRKEKDPKRLQLLKETDLLRTTLGESHVQPTQMLRDLV